jgi:hypothetical protein
MLFPKVLEEELRDTFVKTVELLLAQKEDPSNSKK